MLKQEESSSEDEGEDDIEEDREADGKLATVTLEVSGALTMCTRSHVPHMKVTCMHANGIWLCCSIGPSGCLLSKCCNTSPILQPSWKCMHIVSCHVHTCMWVFSGIAMYTMQGPRNAITQSDMSMEMSYMTLSLGCQQLSLGCPGLTLNSLRKQDTQNVPCYAVLKQIKSTNSQFLDLLH